MKYLLLFIFSLLFTTLSYAQKDSKQPKYVLKSNLSALSGRNFKLGLDIATSVKETWEIQFGVFLEDVNSSKSEFRPHSHLLLRYKYDILPDEENLDGIYLAPGIEGGQWIISDISEGNPAYLNIFTDLGVQANAGIFNVEIFGGVGFTWLDGAEFSEKTDDCEYCGLELTPNTLNMGPILLRLGYRMGISF